MKKILFVATVKEHFLYFYLSHFKMLKKEGYEVECACKGASSIPHTDNFFNIDIERSPFKVSNFRAFWQVRELIKNGKYDLIHCATPVGGALTRLAVASLAKDRKCKLIYMAHGFHFYKGGPHFTNGLYFFLELFLSKYTDYLITINEEDYKKAKNSFKKSKIIRVSGVGYKSEKFKNHSLEEKRKARENLGFREEWFLLVCTAELNKNKNQKLLIDCVKLLEDEKNEVRLLLVGPDRIKGKLQKYVEKLGLKNKVLFLGQRGDVAEILPACDLALASSYREGLPVNIMEALACGLPVIASDNRGHRELIKDGHNGFLIEDENSLLFADKIRQLKADKKLYRKMSASAVQGVKLYADKVVLEDLRAIYASM